MRLAYALLLMPVIPASMASAQNEALASAAAPRVEFKTERIPVKFADGSGGWAQFDVAGAAGQRASGRFILTRVSHHAPPATTEYLVTSGTLQVNQTDFEFVLRGSARQAGTRSAEQFSSRLTLARAPRSSSSSGRLEYTDSWSVQAVATGDTWEIGGLKCTGSDKDGWVCV